MSELLVLTVLVVAFGIVCVGALGLVLRILPAAPTIPPSTEIDVEERVPVPEGAQSAASGAPVAVPET